jgi:sugar diacid utilization regulator/putative methionine-R-sulfoxide reductase with GAF domain
MAVVDKRRRLSCSSSPIGSYSRRVDIHTQQLRGFADACHWLQQADDDREVFQRASDLVRQVLGSDVGWCARRVGEELRIVAHSGLRDPEMARKWRLPVGEGIGGRVAERGETIVIRDYLHDRRRVAGVKSVVDEEGLRSGVVAPIRIGEDVDGVLYAGDRRLRPFGETEVNLVEMLARQTGGVLETLGRRSHLRHRLRSAEQEADELRASARLYADVADVFAETDDIGTGLRLLAGHLGAGVALLDQFGHTVASAGEDNGGARSQFPLRAGSRQMGALVAVTPEPLSDRKSAAVEQVVHLLALLILRERTAMETELRLGAQFLDNLLVGRLEDEQSLVNRASLIGIDLRAPRVVVCVGIHTGRRPTSQERPPPLTRRVADVLESSGRTYGRPIVTLRLGDAVMLLESGQLDLRAMQNRIRELVAATSASVGGMELAAGVGRVCLSLKDYAESYGEANLALALARSRYESGRVLTPEDLGFYGLLARVTHTEALQSMVDGALGPLVGADARSGSEYVKTLEAYLGHDRHLQRTATFLHLHVNTLRYRINRIQDLLGIDLHDVDTRFLLELAVRVNEALGTGRGR